MRWIKKAAVSLLIGDDSSYPRTQVTYNGVTTDAYRMSPYGLSSHPPVGSLAVLLSPDGRRDDPVALIADPLNRFKNLEEGEVEIGNDLTRTSIKFRKDKGLVLTVSPDGDLVVTVAGGNAAIASSTLRRGTSSYLRFAISARRRSRPAAIGSRCVDIGKSLCMRSSWVVTSGSDSGLQFGALSWGSRCHTLTMVPCSAMQNDSIIQNRLSTVQGSPTTGPGHRKVWGIDYNDAAQSGMQLVSDQRTCPSQRRPATYSAEKTQIHIEE